MSSLAGEIDKEVTEIFREKIRERRKELGLNKGILSQLNEYFYSHDWEEFGKYRNSFLGKKVMYKGQEYIIHNIVITEDWNKLFLATKEYKGESLLEGLNNGSIIEFSDIEVEFI